MAFGRPSRANHTPPAGSDKPLNSIANPLAGSRCLSQSPFQTCPFQTCPLRRPQPRQRAARTERFRLFSGPAEDPGALGLAEFLLFLPEDLGGVDVHALEDELVVDVLLAR